MKSLMCFANVDQLLVGVMAPGLVLGYWLSSAAQRLDLPVLELVAGKHQHRESGDSAGGEQFEQAVGQGTDHIPALLIRSGEPAEWHTLAGHTAGLAAMEKGQGAGLGSNRRRDRQDRDRVPGPGREPKLENRSRPQRTAEDGLTKGPSDPSVRAQPAAVSDC